MGLFGGSVTYVTSVVYNLAGDINDRPNYLKSLVVRDNIYETGDKAKSFKDGYINGPGLKLRSFGRWSQGDYWDIIGSPIGSLAGANSLDASKVEDEISASLGGTEVVVQNTSLGRGQLSWWAEQWMLLNHPADVDTAWKADFDSTTNEIVVTLADGTTTYRFTPTNYDTTSQYIYAGYTTVEVIHHPLVPGDPTATPPTEDTPAWDKWTYGPLRVFIYKIGSGNATLDGMVVPDVSDGFYFPIIPMRIDNKFVGPDKDVWASSLSNLGNNATDIEISDAFKAAKTANPQDSLATNFDKLYPYAKRALNKAIGAKFDKVIDSLAKNKSLADIDYAYAVFGVCINTKEAASKLYLWRYFEKLYSTQGSYDPATWQAELAAFKVKQDAYQAWVVGGKVGTAPERPVFPELLNEWVRVYAAGPSDINYDIIINWSGMAHNTGTGLAKAGAVAGDIWWEVGADLEYTEVLYYGSTSTEIPKSQEKVTLYYQETSTSWQAITIWDLVHRNSVYNGKDVEISAKQAILSLDDNGNTIPYEESGFIVPLHYATFRDMPLVKATQMSTACCYLVLNCYKVVKRKWYETFIFKIFLIVVIIAISFVFPPFGATSGGILGSNAAVGMTLGLTGAAAVVLGGIVNAIAAMIVAKLAGMVSTAVFGAKLGAIIGSIAAFAAISIGTSLANGGTFSASFAHMGRADNIMKMANVIQSSYGEYVKASIAGMQEELKDYSKSVNDQLQAVQDAYAANIGSDRAYLDPMAAINRDTYIPETSDAFLSRTLMLGSDVIEFTHSLIHDFTSLTLSSDLP